MIPSMRRGLDLGLACLFILLVVGVFESFWYFVVVVWWCGGLGGGGGAKQVYILHSFLFFCLHFISLVRVFFLPVLYHEPSFLLMSDGYVVISVFHLFRQYFLFLPYRVQYLTLPIECFLWNLFFYSYRSEGVFCADRKSVV